MCHRLPPERAQRNIPAVAFTFLGTFTFLGRLGLFASFPAFARTVLPIVVQIVVHRHLWLLMLVMLPVIRNVVIISVILLKRRQRNTLSAVLYVGPSLDKPTGTMDETLSKTYKVVIIPFTVAFMTRRFHVWFVLFSCCSKVMGLWMRLMIFRS